MSNDEMISDSQPPPLNFMNLVLHPTLIFWSHPLYLTASQHIFFKWGRMNVVFIIVDRKKKLKASCSQPELIIHYYFKYRYLRAVWVLPFLQQVLFNQNINFHHHYFYSLMNIRKMVWNAVGCWLLPRSKIRHFIMKCRHLWTMPQPQTSVNKSSSL